MKRLALFALALTSTTVAAGFSATVECREYVRCAEATGTPKGSLDAKYGPSGNSWASEDEAIVCTEQCVARLDLLVANHPDAGLSRVSEDARRLRAMRDQR